MDVRGREATLYADVWSALPAYGEMSPGEDVARFFRQVAEPGAEVVDVGCGTGRGALALDAAGYRVLAVADLTDAGLCEEARARFPFREACVWRPLAAQLGIGRTDWTFCADVLEHVPEQFTMLAVERMLAVSRRGLFLAVALVPDQFGAWVGQPLHLTVQPFTWWRDALREMGEVVDARDQMVRGVFAVRRAS